MKTYQPTEWKNLLDHATVTEEYFKPANQDAFIKQMILIFYPLVKGVKQVRAEQCYSTMCVTGHEVYSNKLKAPTETMWKMKEDGARLSLEDYLSGEGLERGELRKKKHRADRMSFKWPYVSDFGGDVECVSCNSPIEFNWIFKKGDWIVTCPNCGWKKVFRKAWIDKNYLTNKRIAAKYNSEMRPFSSREDTYYFYFEIKSLLVPEEGESPPMSYCVN